MANGAELFVEATYKIAPANFCAKLLASTGKAQSFEIYNKIFEEGKGDDYSFFTTLGDDRSIDYLRTLLLSNDIELKRAVLSNIIISEESHHIIEKLLDILLYLLKQEHDSEIQEMISNFIIPKVGLKAVKPMLEFLKNKDFDLEVREGAAYALIRRTPEAIGPLLEFLETDNPVIPLLLDAIEIRNRDPVDAINEFIEFLKDDDPTNREYALIAIRSIENPDPKVLPLLVELLGDGDPSIRASTAHTLGVIGNKIGNPNIIVEHIFKLFKDNDEYVRRCAAYALELLCDPRTIQPILELLKNGDTDIESHLAFALGQISYKAHNTVKDALLNAYHNKEISKEIFETVAIGMEGPVYYIVRNAEAWVQYHLGKEKETYSYTSSLPSDDLDKVSTCCKIKLKIGDEAIVILGENKEKKSIHALSCQEVDAAYWS